VSPPGWVDSIEETLLGITVNPERATAGLASFTHECGHLFPAVRR